MPSSARTRRGTPQSDPINSTATVKLRNQRGQTLRTKGLQSRQRIVSTLLTMLEGDSPRELAAADVARAAGMSIASFYSYFRDVTEVLLVAAEQASEAGPDVSDLLSVPWAGTEASQLVRRAIERLVEHNIAHYVIVHLRNNLADEGDSRFAALRSRHARPIVEMLSRQIATHGSLAEPGAVALARAFAPASLLYGMVERIATLLVQQPYSRVADRDELLDAAATIMMTVVRGANTE